MQIISYAKYDFLALYGINLIANNDNKKSGIYIMYPGFPYNTIRSIIGSSTANQSFTTRVNDAISPVV